MAKVTLSNGKSIVASKESFERAFQLIEAYGKIGKKLQMPVTEGDDELHGALNQAEASFAQQM